MGTVVAPAMSTPRPATTHSSRGPPKMATRSPRSTPASTSDAATARARLSHSVHETGTHLPSRLLRSAAAPPLLRAVARNVLTRLVGSGVVMTASPRSDDREDAKAQRREGGGQERKANPHLLFAPSRPCV